MELFSFLALWVLFFAALEDHKHLTVSNMFIVVMFLLGFVKNLFSLELSSLLSSAYFLFLAWKGIGIGKGDVLMLSGLSLVLGPRMLFVLLGVIVFSALQQYKNFFYERDPYPLLPLIWLASFVAVM